MPAQEPTPDAPITDDMILAAIERAQRHRNPKSTPGISLSTLKEHLGLPHHGGTTRRLRPQLKTLETALLIEQYRRNGPDTITLTDQGQRRLDVEPPQQWHKEYELERLMLTSYLVNGLRGNVQSPDYIGSEAARDIQLLWPSDLEH